MEKFRQRMVGEGVIQAFSELGLNFDHLFPGDKENPYSRGGNLWSIGSWGKAV